MRSFYILFLLSYYAAAVFQPDDVHLRHVMLFLFNQQGAVKNAVAATNEINRVYGRNTVSERSGRRWFEKFKNDDFNLETHQGQGGGPKDLVDDQEIEELLEENPFLTQAQIAQRLGITQSGVSRRFDRMGKELRAGKLVPKILTEDQKNSRIDIAEQLLTRNENGPFLNNLVVQDEKWVYWNQDIRRKAWLTPGQDPPQVPRKTPMTNNKRLLSIWYDIFGPIYWELLPPGVTVNSERYVEQLREVHRRFLMRPNRMRHPVLYLHDNARPHTSRLTREFLAQIGWEILPHPSNSPDFNPVDFKFNRYSFVTTFKNVFLEGWPVI